MGGVALASSYTWGVSGRQDDPSTAPAYLRSSGYASGGSWLRSFTLEHTYLGQVSFQLDLLYQSDRYEYDGRGRLTFWNLNGGPPIGSDHWYSFDLSNNMQPQGGGWVFNANNQLTSAPGVTGLTYDNAGNLTSLNGMTLNWDPWGRLSSVTGTPQGTVSFTYDFAGRRVSKTVGGVTTYYLYDGELLLLRDKAASE